MKEHDFHLGEEVLVKNKQDGEYMPDNFLIVNTTGSRLKRNSDGKVELRDASHFKVYDRRNHPMVNVEIRNTESSSTAGD